MKRQKISILDKIDSKPSKALQYMVDGLLKQSKRKNFKIDMGSFGHSSMDGSICYGCAATCAVQEIASKNLTAGKIGASIRSEALNMDSSEVVNFELVIDAARTGILQLLFEFCGKEDKWRSKYNNRFELKTYDWQEELPKVEKLIKELKSKGL